MSARYWLNNSLNHQVFNIVLKLKILSFPFSNLYFMHVKMISKYEFVLNLAYIKKFSDYFLKIEFHSISSFGESFICLMSKCYKEVSIDD